jgi:phosphoenolpyruvate synthase/pyruvate phosphate dikinase
MPTNSYRAMVLSPGRGKVTGVIGKDIIVIPDMHPSRLGVVLSASAVVTEVGGQLCHLAVVSREEGKLVMLLPDAQAVLRDGMRVCLVPHRCEIAIEVEP